MRKIIAAAFLLITFQTFAQKKPLDHSVYDSWESIGEKMISNDGKWTVYTINVQEGDSKLIIQSTDAVYKKEIARGYNAIITQDSRFAIFKIKPLYKDTREAKIKKKKADDFPKDSLAIVELGKDEIWKRAKVKSYLVPQKSSDWLAYQLEKTPDAAPKKSASPEGKQIDSLKKVIDSLTVLNKELQTKKKAKVTDDEGNEIDFADGDELSPANADAGSDLVLRKPGAAEEKIFSNVLEYNFNETGRKLLMEIAKNPKDSLSKAYVLLYDLNKKWMDTLSRGGNDFKNFAMSDDGSRVAYVAERDAAPKDLQKFYRLWYFKEGMDSAIMLADKNCAGMKLGSTVSENGVVRFSRSGNKLFFGTAAIQPPKDTTLVDIDKVNVDVWHYNDDYLQTRQLFTLQNDLKKNYLAVTDLENNSITQLGSEDIPTIIISNEGDGKLFAGITDKGKRIESQWMGETKKDIYAIDAATGNKKLIVKDVEVTIATQYLSPNGNFITWYDKKAKNYFSYDGDSVRNITKQIKVPLYNEEFEEPDDPNPYGVMRWQKDDVAVFIYDRYGVWKVDPAGKKKPLLLIDNRKDKISYRYIQVDPDERYISPSQKMVFRSFDEKNKQSGFWENKYDANLDYFDGWSAISDNENVKVSGVVKAKDSDVYVFTKESYTASPDLYAVKNDGKTTVQLSFTNPQQKQYNWGTTELISWKAYNGKMTDGILYKPENFDSRKKYPMICYFYETLSDSINSYIAPAPTPSKLNIPFFVSRGYIVFTPDIHYGVGHPGKDAYDYIVSGARAVVKKGFVDSTKIGIQGQSWGGYQVAYLITATDLFKAAWAGAPVVNMTSAYGGIRWESGLNRQFQYEKSQSRIGKTLWEDQKAYLDNSPLFRLPKVKTPLVIMSNDADGAVPWYQGIEFFTAMRRLNKKVWLLNYNGEAHNLVERKNRKDIQIREQQYFDWLLKGEKPAKWITEGVPAIKKGKTWGLEIVD